MKKFSIIIVIVFVSIVVLAGVVLYPKNGSDGVSINYEDYVLSYDQSKLPYHKNTIFQEPQLLEIGRLIKVAGFGHFCRVLRIDNSFYVFFKTGDYYNVKGFDLDWQPTGFVKTLTPLGVHDIDQDIAFDGEYVYEYAMLSSAGQIRKFDKEFNLVKQTPVFSAGENEVILDLNIAFINGKIYAGSEYRENNALWKQMRAEGGGQNMPPNTEVARATHLRIYDTELNLLEERDLIANIEGAVVPHQYWAIGASQLYADGYHCVVAASPIGNVSRFNSGENIGARQIFILRFDSDFNFVDSKGPLSDTNHTNFWCTGSLYDDGRYYISYGSSGGGHRLGIFDEEFNELETIIVGGALQGLFKDGKTIYLSYMSQDIAYVQELILKD